MEAKHTHSGQQARTATASAWIGSALEYYDYFIYAQAAALVFPQLFFPSVDSRVAIAASLATYGVGYLARPIGALLLARRGDTHGRKNLLLVCMFMMGLSTLAVGFLPTFAQVGFAAPVLLVILRLIQGFAVAGEISGSSSLVLEHAPFGRRGYFASFAMQGVTAGQVFAAAIFLPLAYFLPEKQFMSWGWRVPFLLSMLVLVAGYVIRRKVSETPAFVDEAKHRQIPTSPVIEALRDGWPDIIRIAAIALIAVILAVTSIFGAAYAVQPAYGIGLPKGLFLWIPLLANLTATIFIPLAGSLSDRWGRRPLIIFGAIGSGLLSYGYLYAISLHNAIAAIAIAIVMWGVVYQCFNAVYTSFMPELFPTRTRVTAMAIGQNIGTAITAILPALIAAAVPPGTQHIPLIVGTITFIVCALGALGAWTARETYRLPVSALGKRDASPLSKQEYNRLRADICKKKPASNVPV
jgi:MFS family permease